MKAIATSLSILILTGILVLPAFGNADKPARPADQPASETAPKIQLAILLDTSGSMRGLINQARTQLWKIVNELATAERDGRTPILHVALYEYGKSSIPKDEGYLRQIVPLTDDLDKISEELFALSTNGGQEYCGQVIDAATKGLQWSGSESDLKLIFIAGNEPFTQGSVDYKDACSGAIEKGITVNTIFCGPEAEGVRTGWKDGAVLADGSFMHIDQNKAVAQIKTPYDKKLAELGRSINTTFLFFGDRANRQSLSRRQVAQDAKAAKAAPAAAAERAAFKGKKQYAYGSSSDLVAAIAGGKVKLEELDEKALPEKLQKMSKKERKEYVEKQAKQREKIQKQINELAEKRKKYIAEQRKKQSETEGAETLDVAIIKVVRDQAARKKFEFKQ